MNINFKTTKGAELLQKALEELKNNGVYIALQLTDWDGGYPKYKNHNGEKHITVKYGLWKYSVDEIKKIVGEMPTTATINTSGYADDGENNGVFVQNPILKRLGVANPYITLSWVEGSAPVHTGELTPTPFESGEKGWKTRVGSTTMWRPNWIPQQINVEAVVFMKDKQFHKLKEIIPKRGDIIEEVEFDNLEKIKLAEERKRKEEEEKIKLAEECKRKEEELQKLASEVGLTKEEYSSLLNKFWESCNCPEMYDYGCDVIKIKIIKKEGILHYEILSYTGVDIYPC